MKPTSVCFTRWVNQRMTIDLSNMAGSAKGQQDGENNSSSKRLKVQAAWGKLSPARYPSNTSWKLFTARLWNPLAKQWVELRNPLPSKCNLNFVEKTIGRKEHRLLVLPSTLLVIKMWLFTNENYLQQILHRSFGNPNNFFWPLLINLWCSWQNFLPALAVRQ